jgi:ATP-dependent helicase STH1/SNF2
MPNFQGQLGATANLPQNIPFNRNQLAELKYQILAYKLISRNLPLPDNLRQAILKTGLSEADSNNDPNLAGARKAVETAYAFNVSNRAVNEGPFTKLANPYSLIKKKITPFAHASREQRLLIPGITPTGIDAQELQKERERRISCRIKNRIDELENLPSTISNEGFLGPGNGNPKLKSLIELKALRLLERQKKMRVEILKGMTRGTTLATSVDRASYRRMKKQTLREARMTEKLERQQRAEREKRHKQKRIDYLNKLVTHGRDMLAWHKNAQQRRQKLARSIIQYHGVVEKEEQKRIERLSKQRLQALKVERRHQTLFHPNFSFVIG